MRSLLQNDMAFTHTSLILLLNVVLTYSDFDLNFFSDVEEYGDTKFAETPFSKFLCGLFCSLTGLNFLITYRTLSWLGHV